MASVQNETIVSSPTIKNIVQPQTEQEVAKCAISQHLLLVYGFGNVQICCAQDASQAQHDATL
jgi:hypothetical protein